VVQIGHIAAVQVPVEGVELLGIQVHDRRN